MYLVYMFQSMLIFTNMQTLTSSNKESSSISLTPMGIYVTNKKPTPHMQTLRK